MYSNALCVKHDNEETRVYFISYLRHCVLIFQYMKIYADKQFISPELVVSGSNPVETYKGL